MRDDWKKLEGQVVNKMFPLRKFLGSTSHSGVFLTQSGHEPPKSLAIKFISGGAKADSQVSLLQRASKLSHPNLLRLLPGGRCQLAGMDLVFVVMSMLRKTSGEFCMIVHSRRMKLAKCSGRFSTHLAVSTAKASRTLTSNLPTLWPSATNSNSLSTQFSPRRTAPGNRPADTYDAPEAGTAQVAASSDIWSLGVTLVEVFTQRSPTPSPEIKPIRLFRTPFHSLSSTLHGTVCGAILSSAGQRHKSRIVSTPHRSRFPRRRWLRALKRRLHAGFPGCKRFKDGSRCECCTCGKKDRSRVGSVAGHHLCLGGSLQELLLSYAAESFL